ncbi:MAG TPA: S1/P1 nuclease [Candidatus Acidoferrum sp.]|jgi:hypothetical protein
MTKWLRLTFVVLLLSIGILVPLQAHAWGCKGHYVSALIAEKHLSPHARAMVAQILEAGPIDPKLSRYCKEAVVDAFADSSTWADDERSINAATAGWHFMDIPRGVSSGNIAQYCPDSTGCVTKATADQLALLRNPNTPAPARADALRYLIHFVGDIHQPLHTTSNNDRGGNCVPIDFFGHAPVETDAQKESFQPNLHSIWDTDLIAQFAGDRTAQQIADDLDSQFKQQIPAWQSASLDPNSWAWEGHEVAERAVYGFLPNKIAIEKPRDISSCADDDHIAMRMLNLNEKLADDYQKAATPVVQEQLAKAGIRLAAILNQLWP